MRALPVPVLAVCGWLSCVKTFCTGISRAPSARRTFTTRTSPARLGGLDGANLTRANLAYADLTGAYLFGADLSGGHRRGDP